MPNGASSTAAARVNASSAPLLALYTLIVGTPAWARREVMLMIAPPLRCARISRAAMISRCIAPIALVSNTARISSAVTSRRSLV